MAIQIRKANAIIKNVSSTNNILFITPFRGHDDGRYKDGRNDECRDKLARLG